MSEKELVERLERLERAHRRLKAFALAALVLATALATIYATQPVSSGKPRDPGTPYANHFSN